MFQLSKFDTKEIDLTPEFVIKSDLDFETLKTLIKYTNDRGLIFVVTGGYATDAQLGGKISRAHGDIDCVIFTTKDIQVQDILEEVQSILSSEKTRWDFSNKKLNKIDCREDHLDIPFNQRRRIEVKVLDEQFDENKFESKELYNSYGESIALNVTDLYELIAGKIHKFYEIKDGVDTNKDRETSLTDIIDLARLLKLKNLNKEKLLTFVSVEEYEYVTNLLASLSSEIAKYLN